MGELGRAARIFAPPVRRFREFPGDRWGRQAVWYTSLVNGRRISVSEARRRFYAGKPVAYATRRGYAAWVVYDPKGKLPAKARSTVGVTLVDLDKWETIPNCEHVKRAIEVAAAGKLSLAMLARDEGLAEVLAKWARELGVPKVYVLKPCPCGHYGSQIRACRCTPSQIRDWRRRAPWQEALREAQMWTTVVELGPDEVLAVLGGARGEPFEDVKRRVEAARKLSPPRKMTQEAKKLLHKAIQHFGLSYMEIRNVLATAQAVARLAGEKEIQTEHVAEALQYRPEEG